MNGSQHTDEHMNGCKKVRKASVATSMTKLNQKEKGDRNGVKNKEKHRRGKTLTLVFACFFFP